MVNEKKRILMVDDDELQHTIAKNMTKDEYDLCCVKSGTDALDYLYGSNTVPNLILLDVLMPEMDGWEVFNRIRGISLLKNVPIAFLTSLSEEEERAFEIGAVDFICKPYDKETLLSRIKKAIDKQ